MKMIARWMMAACVLLVMAGCEPSKDQTTTPNTATNASTNAPGASTNSGAGTTNAPTQK